jgi:hypothetical protein
MNLLRLPSSEVFSSLPDGEGTIIDVKFYVHAAEDEATDQAFFLEVVTEKGYDAWYLAREVALGRIPDDEVFPLVIPEEFAGQGLIEYVKSRYLDPQHPDRINEIKQFLFGPLEDMHS